MQSVQVGEFKAELSSILDRVKNKGEKFVIEYGKRHKKVAMIVPYEEDVTEDAFDPKSFYGASNAKRVEVDKYLNDIKEEWETRL